MNDTPWFITYTRTAAYVCTVYAATEEDARQGFKLDECRFDDELIEVDAEDIETVETEDEFVARCEAEA
jgi:hypothetical protein